MLKTGIKSAGYFSYNNDESAGLALAKEHGFDCLDYGDFTAPTSAVLHLPKHHYEAYLTRLQRTAQTHGIAFNQAHGLWEMDERNLDERKSNLERYKKQILGCAFLQCPYLVMHPCLPNGWARIVEKTENRAETLRANVEVIEALLPTAKQYGVTLCLENLPFVGYSLTHAHDIKELIVAIGDSNVKACLDTGHANATQESVYEAVKVLGSDLACLHIHDNKGRGDPHDIPYRGNIDWSAFTTALREIRFQGVISLETVAPSAMPQPMKQDVQRVLAGLARYFAIEADERV